MLYEDQIEFADISYDGNKLTFSCAINEKIYTFSFMLKFNTSIVRYTQKWDVARSFSQQESINDKVKTLLDELTSYDFGHYTIKRKIQDLNDIFRNYRSLQRHRPY
jgi:hypothetical protein